MTVSIIMVIEIVTRALHRDDGHVPGVGVTLNYTDTREGCLLVDLSIDIGTNPRWREGHDLIGA